MDDLVALDLGKKDIPTPAEALEAESGESLNSLGARLLSAKIGSVSWNHVVGHALQTSFSLHHASQKREYCRGHGPNRG